MIHRSQTLRLRVPAQTTIERNSFLSPSFPPSLRENPPCFDDVRVPRSNAWAKRFRIDLHDDSCQEDFCSISLYAFCAEARARIEECRWSITRPGLLKAIVAKTRRSILVPSIFEEKNFASPFFSPIFSLPLCLEEIETRILRFFFFFFGIFRSIHKWNCGGELRSHSKSDSQRS